jgi:hypothetical protein
VTESFEQGKGKHKGQKFENEPAVSGGPGSSPADYEQDKGKKKGHEHGEQTPGYGSTITPQNSNANLGNQGNPQGDKRKGKRDDEYNQPGSQNAGGGPSGYGGGGKHRDQQIQSQGQPQGGQSDQQGGQQQGGQGKGKGKKGESPTPPPQ